MNHEQILSFCEKLAHTTVETPFGPDTVVFKVGGKMFALLSLKSPMLSLKCEPALAEQLREVHSSVRPGYHMNKKHWNSIYWEEEELSHTLLREWIQQSYDLVFQSLPKSVQASLKN